MELKIGDMLVCKDGLYYKHLTTGKLYKVCEVDGNWATIKCDDGAIKGLITILLDVFDKVIKANKLSRKLYPNAKEEKGYLIIN